MENEINHIDEVTKSCKTQVNHKNLNGASYGGEQDEKEVRIAHGKNMKI